MQRIVLKHDKILFQKVVHQDLNMLSRHGAAPGNVGHRGWPVPHNELKHGTHPQRHRFVRMEFIVGLCIGIPFVVIVGFSPWMLVLYELFDVCVTLWTHSNLRLPAGVDRILHYVIATPTLHRIHHSTWQRETDSNFSAVFPVWDIIFGTFRPTPRTDPDIMPLGLEEVRGSRANRLPWLLVSPFYKQLTDAPIDTPTA